MDMVGNLLYTERRKKGLEIVDIEQSTGIRGVYLTALEQGKYEVLPGEVYIKGFIRNYGNFLGLDGAHLVHLYSESVAPSVVPPPVTPANVPAAKKNVPDVRFQFSKKTISTLVVLLILILSSWGLYAWQQSQSPKASEKSKESAAIKTKSASTTNSSSEKSPAGAVSSVPSTSSRPVVLVARYNDRCWTSVIADGKTLYEGIPKLNETLTWEADRQIVVNFGNAAAVELTFNGQPVGKIGERGDVVVKTFSLAASPTDPKPLGSRP